MKLLTLAALVLACSCLCSWGAIEGGVRFNDVRSEMILGLGLNPSITGGIQAEITEEAFREFLNDVVSPRFPDGFSVLDIPVGQFINDQGEIVRERNKLLLIYREDSFSDLCKLIEIGREYIARFRQELVILSEQPAENIFIER